MNATLTYEPFKLPAGILALAVHLAFFALLYFGFSWQNIPPETMSVDLWQSLPEPVKMPPEQVKPLEIIKPTQPPAQIESIVKPDIALPEKKKKIEAKATAPKLPAPKKIEVEAIDDKPLPKIIADANPAAPVVKLINKPCKPHGSGKKKSRRKMPRPSGWWMST